MENLASTYHDLGKYLEAEELQIQVLDARNKVPGEEHPDIKDMGNLTVTQKTMRQIMKMDNADNQLSNKNHGVSVAQDMEGEHVDNGGPYASHRGSGEDVSDAVAPPENLSSITNAHDRMIHSQKKGI